MKGERHLFRLKPLGHFYGGTFGPRTSGSWRKQMMIIILADKTDPHLPAANASFSERTAAASDEWSCLLCSV